VDSLDINCRTPLMLAAACNLPQAVTLLVDCGADINATDIEGNTALHLAYAFGSISCALFLESRGADTNILNTSSRTPSEEAGRQSTLIPIFGVTAGARTGASLNISSSAIATASGSISGGVRSSDGDIMDVRG
jgi:ankyrin repeat protein